MFGAGSSYKADIDIVDIVLDLHGKWKPWSIPNHWSSSKFNKPQIIDMYIADGTAPYWVGKQFWKALWNDLLTEASLSKVKPLRVLVTCMGGHGRTGTVLVALAIAAGAMPKKQDPIAWMRERYCEHAIETTVQIAYLEKTFGFTTDETPYKFYSAPTKTTGGTTQQAVLKSTSVAPAAEIMDMYDYLNGGV